MRKYGLFTAFLTAVISFLSASLLFPIFQPVPVTDAVPPGVLSLSITQTPSAAQDPDGATAAAAQPASPDQDVLGSAVVVAGDEMSGLPDQTRVIDPARLELLVASVSGKDKDQIAGVYVPGVLSVPVLQQPPGYPNFVSTEDNSVTQFGLANKYGAVGLLAHNYLSGQKFLDFRLGDEVVLVYGDGRQSRYKINRIERYQALSSTDAYSTFVDANDLDGRRLTSTDVFHRIYASPNRLVFQTCLEANGDPSWGRLFVIAEPVE
jgi:hypothetical protein